MIHQYPVHPKNHLPGGHQKKNFAEFKTFSSTVKNELLTSNKITLKTILLKMNKGFQQHGEEILFNPERSLLLSSQDKGKRFVVVVKENHRTEMSTFVELNYDPTKELMCCC